MKHIIIGKSDESKGDREIPTRNVRRVATLKDEANTQQREVLQNRADNKLEELAHERQAGHFAIDH